MGTKLVPFQAHLIIRLSHDRSVIMKRPVVGQKRRNHKYIVAPELNLFTPVRNSSVNIARGFVEEVVKLL